MTVSSTTSSSSTGTVYTADQLLDRARGNTTDQESKAGILSANDLLQRAKNTASGGTNDKVEVSTTVQSGVDKLLAASKKTTVAAKETYEDQDWYIKAKVAQLKTQISLYSTLPGLDTSGGVIDDLTKQVNDLVKKQQAKLKTANDATAAAQKKIADDQKSSTANISTADQLLAKAQGKTTAAAPSSDVQALLDKARGGTVNTSA